MAVRRDVVAAYLGQLKVKEVPHDWALAVISDCQKGLYFLNKTTIHYRLHSSNAIGLTKPPTTIAQRMHNIQKQKEMYNELGLYLLPAWHIRRLSKLQLFSSKRIHALTSMRLLDWIKCTRYGIVLPFRLCMLPLLKDLTYIIRKD